VINKNYDLLTRTIKVSCLSRFLLLPLLPRQIRNTVAPGLAHLLATKILHLDKFLAPRQLLPRHCAGAHLQASCNRDKFPATYQLCTATLVMLDRHRTMTEKTRAIPSWHRDCFAAKVPGSARCSRRVTQPPFIAGPLAVSPLKHNQIKTCLLSI
jgi:hypothetical protein